MIEVETDVTNTVKFGRGDPNRVAAQIQPKDLGNGPTPVTQAPDRGNVTEFSTNAANNDQPPGANKPRRAKASRNRFVVFFNFMFSLLVFALLALSAIFYYGKSEFTSAGPHDAEQIFVVRPGATVGQISTNLRRSGLISDERIFEYGTRAFGNESAFKAGEYEIAAGASMQSIMDTLVEGKAILHPLTIVEGMTVTKAWERIAANEILVGDMPEQMPAEGMLIADTQRFSRGTTRAELVDKMKAQQASLIEEVWANRVPDLPINSPEEMVTLASIVEKETAVAAERPKVASVFVNRLRQGIRLQSDPTIIYGIFGGEGKPADRPIYRSDIDTPTDYNTYTIPALPPGPIAIPGRASLEAVANPAQTDYLFFVADGTGGHVFARTLDEHNANVANWRRIEREREAEQPQTPQAQ